MEGCSPTQRELKAHPLHSFQVEPRAYFNRVHSLVYICAILGLFYHRLLQLFHCTTFSSFSVFLTMLLSEAVLAFMWLTTFSFRWRPTRRQAFPENLSKLIKDEDLPSLDVFICTADPYKEPPVNVVNTALSVMAFDYPTEKISVYVSDDGGSELTLFAFMEGAKFARHWLPFCRENGIEERCPEAYFRSTEGSRRRGYKIKARGRRKEVFLPEHCQCKSRTAWRCEAVCFHVSDALSEREPRCLLEKIRATSCSQTHLFVFTSLTHCWTESTGAYIVTPSCTQIKEK
ncbi:hypothetical protein MRB53_035737 [Persea americana]|uniref:Uncharacterized protein n=1 Tax=Persea americana TaxID=3435 RepID=A0ACC2K5J0_PERAE|nr:hypothetical protein MRB53_035737 [Persea americana]